MRQVLFDTETTGLSKNEHRLVSLAAIEMVDGELTGGFAHWHLNPGRPSDPGALAIHGLSDEYLATQPRFADIGLALLDFICGSPLIIHNAPFDIGFLESEMTRAFSSAAGITSHTRCTLEQSRRTRGWRGRNKLDHLVEEYRIPNLRAETGKHGALVDTLLLFNVYRALNGREIVDLVPFLPHFLDRGFGVHGHFEQSSTGGASLSPSSESDSTGVAADIRAVG
jgi:DNA polymerase III subunit epsilon